MTELLSDPPKRPGTKDHEEFGELFYEEQATYHRNFVERYREKLFKHGDRALFPILERLSLFRFPVSIKLFDDAFLSGVQNRDRITQLKELDQTSLLDKLDSLARMHLVVVTGDENSTRYQTHSSIRIAFRECMEQERPIPAKTAHQQIAAAISKRLKTFISGGQTYFVDISREADISLAGRYVDFDLMEEAVYHEARCGNLASANKLLISLLEGLTIARDFARCLEIIDFVFPSLKTLRLGRGITEIQAEPWVWSIRTRSLNELSRPVEAVRFTQCVSKLSELDIQSYGINQTNIELRKDGFVALNPGVSPPRDSRIDFYYADDMDWTSLEKVEHFALSLVKCKFSQHDYFRRRATKYEKSDSTRAMTYAMLAWAAEIIDIGSSLDARTFTDSEISKALDHANYLVSTGRKVYPSLLQLHIAEVALLLNEFKLAYDVANASLYGRTKTTSENPFLARANRESTCDPQDRGIFLVDHGERLFYAALLHPSYDISATRINGWATIGGACLKHAAFLHGVRDIGESPGPVVIEKIEEGRRHLEWAVDKFDMIVKNFKAIGRVPQHIRASQMLDDLNNGLLPDPANLVDTSTIPTAIDVDESK